MKTRKQGMSSTFFFALEVALDFQFGFQLMFIFSLHVFKVHQHLDFASTSYAFKWLELATTIVVKLTIVGMTIVGMNVVEMSFA
jgi:hypothetical protein